MNARAFRLPDDDEDVQAGLLYSATATKTPDGLLVLAHGAGAGHTSPFMVAYATGLAARGLDVVTFNFPYMQRGRRAPDRAPLLEDAFRRAVAGAVAHPDVRGKRLYIGGKSMGGRMAVRLASSPDAWPSTLPPLTGVVVFGYPLKPPGGGKGDRTSHFATLSAPTMIVQGSRDSFGGPEDIKSAAPTVTVHAVDRGDHSFNVPKSAGIGQEAVHTDVMDAVIEWIRRS